MLLDGSEEHGGDLIHCRRIRAQERIDLFEL
jgi:hypothetical protein